MWNSLLESRRRSGFDSGAERGVKIDVAVRKRVTMLGRNIALARVSRGVRNCMLRHRGDFNIDGQLMVCKSGSAC